MYHLLFPQKFLLLEEVDSSVEKFKDNKENLSIAIKGVSASWSKKMITNTLNDISFTVPQNKLYAIVGPVGAGKVFLKNLVL